MNTAPAWIKAPKSGRGNNPLESPSYGLFISAPAPRESPRARYSLSGDPGVVEPVCHRVQRWFAP